MQPAGDVALHEHRAAFPQARGSGGGKRQPGEFVLDGDPQLLGLFFQKRARSGGAGFVHGEIHHHAVFDGDELGILTADFEDGVHRFAAQRMADVDGAGLVRGDFVVHRVGAHELRDQLAPRAGGAHAAHLEPFAPDAFHFREALLHRFDGTPRGAQIDIVNHRAGCIDHRDVGRDRADIEPNVGRDGITVGRRHVHTHAVAQLHHMLGG